VPVAWAESATCAVLLAPTGSRAKVCGAVATTMSPLVVTLPTVWAIV
jgi:hypothetical protein